MLVSSAVKSRTTSALRIASWRAVPESLWEKLLLSSLRMGQQDVLAEMGPPKGGETMVRLSDRAGTLVTLAQWVDGEGGGKRQLFRVFASPGTA